MSYKDFLRSFVELFFLLGISSLVVFFLSLFVPGIASNDEYFSWRSLVYVRDISRNGSIFWEPGAFQTFLVLALLFELYSMDHFPRITYVFVFIVALITTFSTTGYFALLVLLICFLIDKHSNRSNQKIQTFEYEKKNETVQSMSEKSCIRLKKKWKANDSKSSMKWKANDSKSSMKWKANDSKSSIRLIKIVLVVFGIIMIALLIIFRSTLFDTTNYSTFGKFMNANGDIEIRDESSAAVRFYSVTKPWSFFLESPIYGVGSERLAKRLYDYTGAMCTCTIANYFAYYGIFYGLIMCYMYLRLSWMIRPFSRFCAGIMVVLILITSSENYASNGLLLLPLLYGGTVKYDETNQTYS